MATISKHLGKRRTTFKVRIRKPGSPTVTRTFSSRSLAEKWARKTELAIEESNFFDQDVSRAHTINDLVDRYIREDLERLSESDQGVRSHQLEWWKDRIGTLTLNRITPALIA